MLSEAVIRNQLIRIEEGNQACPGIKSAAIPFLYRYRREYGGTVFDPLGEAVEFGDGFHLDLLLRLPAALQPFPKQLAGFVS